MRIACVGTGVIGRSWALLFALRGHEVNLYDVSEEVLRNARVYARSWLEAFTLKEKWEKKKLEETMARLRPTTNLRAAVEGVDYVQESTPEDLGLKKNAFREVSLIAKPSTILASSTSGLSMSEIQKASLRPERCITVHPINPPHLIPLVEIVRGRETSEDSVRRVYDFMSALGKTPVVLRREVPGFIFNRLSAVLWREALDLLDKGVATAEDIDKVVSSALGLRFAVMGPFLTYHLGGGEKGLEYFIEHLGPAFSDWWRSMATWTTIPSSAAEKAVEGVEQMESVKEKPYNTLIAHRDERLMELLKLLHGWSL